MRTNVLISLCAASLLTACAEGAQNIPPSYVSPLAYNSLTCRQIEQEARRLSTRVSQVAGVQDANANSDAVAAGVALVLFWPAVVFISGNKANAAELSRLKGEMEALEQASINRGCGIVFQKPESKPEAVDEETHPAAPSPGYWSEFNKPPRKN